MLEYRLEKERHRPLRETIEAADAFLEPVFIRSVYTLVKAGPYNPYVQGQGSEFTDSRNGVGFVCVFIVDKHCSCHGDNDAVSQNAEPVRDLGKQ